jgi:uncharacterized protein YcbK (DUF882 family)
MTEIQQYVRQLTDYLSTTWGLDDSYAESVAVLLLYLNAYGVSFTITSGYRSAAKQNELRSRYEAGDGSIVVKPATKSQHSTTNWIGQPAATAIDLCTSAPVLAAQIANALGIGAGYYFKTPDPVHFYKK